MKKCNTFKQILIFKSQSYNDKIKDNVLYSRLSGSLALYKTFTVTMSQIFHEGEQGICNYCGYVGKRHIKDQNSDARIF